jgi:hypothetical protein
MCALPKEELEEDRDEIEENGAVREKERPKNAGLLQ